MPIWMSPRFSLCTLVMLVSAVAPAQQAPPPPPSAATTAPSPTPGLTPDLAEATRMIREGQYASARVKIDAALAANAKNPQARFLRGVVQADQDPAEGGVGACQAPNRRFPRAAGAVQQSGGNRGAARAIRKSAHRAGV